MFVRDSAKSGSGVISEATLFRQAQSGDHDSLNVLMDRHQGLVHTVVGRQVLGDLPFDEALQAGRIGLWRAIVGFDPSRGFAFSTYAWPAIQRRVWRAVKRYTRFYAASEELDSLHSLLEEGSGVVPTPSPDPERVWEMVQVHRTLHALIQCLSPRLRYVIVTRYGLNGHPRLFYRQIGDALGMCGERVRQLHTEALVWLRHPAHSYALRSLLGRHSLADYQEANVRAQRWLRWRGGHHGR